MIHDYFISSIINALKNFEDWEKENKNKIQHKNDQEKYNLWLEEIFMLPLAKQKKNNKEKLAENKNINCFYPSENDIQNLPQNTTLLKISFTLKKPYTSKNEGEFNILNEKFLWEDINNLKKYLKDNNYINLNKNDIKVEKDSIIFNNGNIKIEGDSAILMINKEKRHKFIVKKDNDKIWLCDGKITENPIVRDKFTGLPMVKPSTWKGHLRFAANKVEWKNEQEKKEIIKRLFGSEPEEKNNPLKGRLYFFPSFFNDEAEKDVITPLKRETRTPARGPIDFEVINPGKKSDFYLLYFPYPEIENKKDVVDNDLKFLAEALKLMFYTYGFSAKKTSGFGVIEEKLEEGKLWIKISNDVRETDFSNLEDLNKKIEELKLKP
jgi:CRISPR-associated protein Cmr2